VTVTTDEAGRGRPAEPSEQPIQPPEPPTQPPEQPTPPLTSAGRPEREVIGAGGRNGHRPGDAAPDFCLDGTGGRTYCLADHRGEPVLLVFYPADNSPVCTQQLRSYSEDLNKFEELGAAVLCLSPQDVASHEAFATAQGLRLPLLSDEDKAVGQAYGVLGPLGFYRRSVFVVDRDGVIRFARRSLSNLTYLPTKDLVEAIRATES
jgi:thioredoxin-dependent peroxiredoxin